MGKRDAQILAFLHFAVTEMRPLWILWYTVYNTFENVVTGASISDAYQNSYVIGCLNRGKITAQDIKKCAKSAYKKYLTYGPQKTYKDCSEKCPGSGVGIEVPEPRIMFFFMTVWLLGFLLVLFVYCIYRHPDYHTGRYIKFTQTLYASKAYKIVAYCTFVVSVIIIFVGIYLLIKYENSWSQYAVALILMVMASRSLIRKKSNGLDINSEKFCQLKISRGNAFMRIVNFFLKTNAAVLDKLEVQFMKKFLPDDIAAPDQRRTGWSALFNDDPFIETTSTFNVLKNQNVDEKNGNIPLQTV